MLIVLDSRLRGSDGNGQALTDLAFEQELGHFGRNLLRALVELRGREISDRMRHFQKTEFRQTPTASHCPSGGFEHVRDNGRRGNTMLFEYYAVEDTPRAA